MYDDNNQTGKRKTCFIALQSRQKHMHNTVIDGNIKVVGIGDFPWIVEDDDLYETKNEK